MPYDPTNVFARILRDELPSERVYEDDEFVAFRDAAPQAPTHIVLIPRGEAAASPADLREADATWIGRMMVLAARIAADAGLSAQGYRLVINCGTHGGQTVPHLHLHIVGGRQLGRLG
ncbi:MAG: histidine triad nucleotide-binding protein [Dehalococcoidia bacterium]